jgi:carbon-monoxide dehydrogenase medium subunit
MKARSFRYIKPRSLEHAYRVLEEGGGEAVPLAGGQSLLATLNMRLSAPKLLVDISEIRELAGCSQNGSEIRLGALTRHCELQQSDLIRDRLPLLAQAAAHIGHVAIRNRGTLGGSLAYADPAAELPACSVALAARIVIGGSSGEREVDAHAFFKGLFDTDLAPGELILAVRFPVGGDSKRVSGFAELARRRGDFALAGVAAVVDRERDRAGDARIVYFGCVDHARIARSVSAAVNRLPLPLTQESSAAIDLAVAQDLSPEDVPGLRAGTQIRLAQVLTRRVLNSLPIASQSQDGH